ncbi:hypothetical protein JK358_35480 [Nocardia sp. 2]|uniref:Uncharacterized protein n=1 Tax=Nocardia acididurans TaxID=2802282 RepID=A0ABS1MJ65_9NOCA|nr:hypothetical protein [Nocardia acididurans]MBL1079719.1 hypothetical protein [Nocardia acididurans]
MQAVIESHPGHPQFTGAWQQSCATSTTRSPPASLGLDFSVVPVTPVTGHGLLWGRGIWNASTATESLDGLECEAVIAMPFTS